MYTNNNSNPFPGFLRCEVRKKPCNSYHKESCCDFDANVKSYYCELL